MGKKIVIFLFAFFALPCSVFGLAPLSENQMKDATAQAGITIAVEDMTLYSHIDAVQITEPGNPNSYMRLENIESFSNFLFEAEHGPTGAFTLDLFTVNDTASAIDGKPLLYIDASHWNQTTSTTIDSINMCGTPIGSMSIDAFSTPSFHLYLGAHDAGVDMEFGAQVTIDQFSYRDEPGKLAGVDTLTLSGITLAGSFTGAPETPSAWEPSGEFTFGNIMEGNPVTLDVAADNNEFLSVNGTDGNPLPNPRFGSGFIALNVPMEGSIRVEHMKVEGNDLGAFALDNIKAHKLYIEIPGRGLGAAYK